MLIERQKKGQLVFFRIDFSELFSSNNKFTIHILWMLFLLASCMACQKEKNASGNNRSAYDSLSIDSVTRKLIEDVLNIPGVKKISKFEFVSQHYERVYIQYAGKDITSSTLTAMNGYDFSLVGKRDSIDGLRYPCFRFSRISIVGDTAEVQMIFKMTGGLVSGKFIFRDNHWIPSEGLLIGRM